MEVKLEGEGEVFRRVKVVDGLGWKVVEGVMEGGEPLVDIVPGAWSIAFDCSTWWEELHVNHSVKIIVITRG